MLRRNGPAIKYVESVLRLEGSLWWERFQGSIFILLICQMQRKRWAKLSTDSGLFQRVYRVMWFVGVGGWLAAAP